MKKLLAFVICLFGVMALSACADKDEDMSVTKPDVDFDFDEFYEANKDSDAEADDNGNADEQDPDVPSGTDASSEEEELEESDYGTCYPSQNPGYSVFDTQFFLYEMPDEWADTSRDKNLLGQMIIPPDSNGLITFMITKSQFDDKSIKDFYDELISEGREADTQVRLFDDKIGSADARVLEYSSAPNYSTRAYFFEVNGQQFYMFFATEGEEEVIDFSKIEPQMEHILSTFKTK